VALLAIVLASVLGTIMGVARLSRNWLIAKLASVYVELMRNMPLLLQLFFWYTLITEKMPGPRQAYTPLPGVFLSNRGLKIPALQGDAIDAIVLGLAMAIVLVLVLAHWARKRQDASGHIFSIMPWALLILAGLPLLGWWISGASLALDVPVLRGFNFVGGLTLSPEMAALLAGLVIYTSAFIAEVVRAGIQSVARGQWEATGFCD